MARLLLTLLSFALLLASGSPRSDAAAHPTTVLIHHPNGTTASDGAALLFLRRQGQNCATNNVCPSGSFCKVERCQPTSAVAGLPEIPCGKCRPCSQCECHSDSVSGRCPAGCGAHAFITHIQGTFVSQGRCNIVWVFSGLTFSEIPDSSEKPGCSGGGGGRHGTFSLKRDKKGASIVLSYSKTAGGLGLGAGKCGVSRATVINDCSGRLDLQWGEGDADCHAGKMGRITLKPAEAEAGIGAGGGLEGLWEGEVAYFTSRCRVTIEAQNLLSNVYRWSAYVGACSDIAGESSNRRGGLLSPAANSSILPRGDDLIVSPRIYTVKDPNSSQYGSGRTKGSARPRTDISHQIAGAHGEGEEEADGDIRMREEWERRGGNVRRQDGCSAPCNETVFSVCSSAGYCTCGGGSEDVGGGSCVSTSNLYIEQIRVNGLNLIFRISWDMKSPAARGDMVAVYKKGRQLFWFYTSSGCTSSTDAACHVLGTSPSPSSSVEFTSPSGGEGVYIAVLWSGTYSSVVANAGRVLSPLENLAKYTPFLEGFGLTSQDVEGSLPGASYPTSVPADAWASQVGGVVAASGMGACDLDPASCFISEGEDPLPPEPTPAPTPTPTTTPAPLGPPPGEERCGDGRVSWDAGELCDDGNMLAGDGCSASCATEGGWRCTYEVVRESWRDGDGVWSTLNGTDSACYELIFCGNKARDTAEQCDDGNTVDGDGCSSQCVVEDGWRCSSAGLGEPDVCSGEATAPPEGGTCDCPNGQDCVYYQGVQRCACSQFYRASGAYGFTSGDVQLDPQQCVDIDQCVEGTHDCASDDYCKNIAGGWQCVCPDGYVGGGTVFDVVPCADVNECVEIDPFGLSETGYLHNCDAFANCTNLAGGYECNCVPGFEGGGQGQGTCKDINECQQGIPMPCGVDNKCTNLPGGSLCECSQAMSSNLSTITECFPSEFSASAAFWSSLGLDTTLSTPKTSMWPEGILRTGHEPYLAEREAGVASITITADDGTSTGLHAGLMARVGHEDEPSYACRACNGGVEAMGKGSGRVEVPQGMYHEEFECVWHWPLSVWNVAMRWEIFSLDDALDTVELCEGFDADMCTCSGNCPDGVAVPPPGIVSVSKAPFTLKFRTRPPPEGTGPRPVGVSTTEFKISMAFVTFDFGKTSPWPINSTAIPAPAPSPDTSPSLPFLKIAISSLASTSPGWQQPCGFQHRKESLSAQFTLKKDESMRLPSVDMAGDYTGTCKAMLEGDSLPPKECRVDLSLSLSGIFRVTITSCDGYSAPSLARGFMLRGNQSSESDVLFDAIDINGKKIGQYRQVIMAYSSGVPIIPGTQRHADHGVDLHATWAWDSTDPEQVFLNVLREGQLSQDSVGTRFPGPLMSNLRYGSRTCQVMTLKRVSVEDISVSPIPPLPSEEQLFDRDLRLTSLYAACYSAYASVQAIPSSSCPLSSAVLQTFSIPLTSRSPPPLCSAPCFESFSTSLRNALDTCSDGWSSVLAADLFSVSVPSNILASQVRGYFFARMLSLANSRFVLDTSCASSWDNATCSFRSTDYPKIREISLCPSYRPAPAKAYGLITSFDEPFEGARECPLTCEAAVLQLLSVYGCCASLIDSAIAKWWKVLDPGGVKRLAEDLTAYDCLYGDSSTSPSSSSPSSCISSASRTGIVVFARGGDVASLATMCREKIASQCCSQVTCSNGGFRPHHGSCWCTCPNPFTGATCASMEPHALIAFNIPGLSWANFPEEEFLASSSELLSTTAAQSQMASVVPIPSGGGRRSQEGSQVTVRFGVGSEESGKKALEIAKYAVFTFQGKDSVVLIVDGRPISINLASIPRAFAMGGIDVCDYKNIPCEQGSSVIVSGGQDEGGVPIWAIALGAACGGLGLFGCMAGTLFLLYKTGRLPRWIGAVAKVGKSRREHVAAARKKRTYGWMQRKGSGLDHTDWKRHEETEKAPPKQYKGIWGESIHPPKPTGALWEKPCVDDYDHSEYPRPIGVHDISSYGGADTVGSVKGGGDIELSLLEDARGEREAASASSRMRDGGGSAMMTSRSNEGSVCSATGALNTSRSTVYDNYPSIRARFDDHVPSTSAGFRDVGAMMEEEAASTAASAVSESIYATGTLLSRMSATNRAIARSQNRLMNNIAMIAEGKTPSRSIRQAEEIRGDSTHVVSASLTHREKPRFSPPPPPPPTSLLFPLLPPSPAGMFVGGTPLASSRDAPTLPFGPPSLPPMPPAFFLEGSNGSPGPSLKEGGSVKASRKLSTRESSRPGAETRGAGGAGGGDGKGGGGEGERGGGRALGMVTLRSFGGSFSSAPGGGFNTSRSSIRDNASIISSDDLLGGPASERGLTTRSESTAGNLSSRGGLRMPSKSSRHERDAAGGTGADRLMSTGWQPKSEAVEKMLLRKGAIHRGNATDRTSSSRRMSTGGVAGIGKLEVYDGGWGVDLQDDVPSAEAKGNMTVSGRGSRDGEEERHEGDEGPSSSKMPHMGLEEWISHAAQAAKQADVKHQEERIEIEL